MQHPIASLLLASEVPELPAPSGPFSPFEWGLISIAGFLAIMLIIVLVKYAAPRWVKETAASTKTTETVTTTTVTPSAATEVNTAQIEAHIEEDNRRFSELKTILVENHRESNEKMDRVLTETSTRFDKMLELHTQHVAGLATHAAQIKSLENTLESTGAHTAIARLTEQTKMLDREVQSIRGRLSSASLVAAKPR